MTTSVPTTIPVPENVILDLCLYGSAMVITGLDGQEHIGDVILDVPRGCAV